MIFLGDGQTKFCSGDSGGPLTVNDIQIGIVSFNYKNCEGASPDIFTRVSEYTNWLWQNSDILF